MSRNSYYCTCPYCGSNLDPGERCDCLDDDEVTTVFTSDDDDSDYNGSSNDN